MSTTDSVADELRRAAQRITDVAEDATPGPWETGGNRSVKAYGGSRVVATIPGGLMSSMANGDHVALWGPDIAVLVAHWLDVATERWEADPLAVSEEECDEIYQPAIALARAINGGAS